MEAYSLEVKVQKIAFYDEQKMFGIYGCVPVEKNMELELNKYGNITIQGTSQKLLQDKVYTIKFEGAFKHAKYGAFYKMIVVQAETLDTIEQQDQFLQSIVSKRQFSILKRAYPTVKLVDLIQNDKVNVALTKGIKEATLEKIKRKVNDQLKVSALLIKLNQLSISPNQLKKIMRFYGDVEKAINAINQDIYNLCDIPSFGFKTIDQIAQKRGDDPENTPRIEACIKYLLKADMGNGHTWSIKSQLLQRGIELLNISLGAMESSLANMPKNIIFQNESQVAYASIRNKELEILSHLKRINKHYTPPKKQHIESRLKAIELAQGFVYTDEQRTAIVEGSQSGVMILNGLAGAGKSATVKGLVDSLDSDNYMTAALSGKAVNVLSLRGIDAATIHRMLKMREGRFLHDESNPLPYEIVVLDEMSMNEVSIVLHVLKAIENGCKLILVGDNGQLPAIGYGDVLRDLLTTTMFQKFELTKVHRQAAKSGILSLANHVRKGKQVFPFNSGGQKTFGELEDQTVVSYYDKEAILEDLLNIANAYQPRIEKPEDLYDFQVIVANKKRGNLSVLNLNKQLQGIFNDLDLPGIEHGDYVYREGDKIITQGNVYGAYRFKDLSEYYEYMQSIEELDEEEIEQLKKPDRVDFFNGTIGHIDTISFTNEVIFIKLEGIDGIIPLEQEEFSKIEMAYAISVHKSQGSSVKYLVFALDYGAYTLLSKQLVYTALTRASYKGIALVENNALYSAIKTDASGNRRTFLADFISSELYHE